MANSLVAYYEIDGDDGQPNPRTLYYPNDLKNIKSQTLPTQNLALAVSSTGGDATIDIQGGTINQNKDLTYSYNFFGDPINITNTSTAADTIVKVLHPHLKIVADVPAGCILKLIVTSGVN
jgi:hypothetical protein